MTLSVIAEYINKAFDQHYDFGEFNIYHEEQDGEETQTIINELLDIDFHFCEILQRILASDYGERGKYYEDQPKYGEDVCYVLANLDWYGAQSEWTAFEKMILEQTRFFGKETKKYLDKTFKNLDGLATKNDESVFTLAGPGTEFSSFYRGRYFHNEDELFEAMQRPDIEIEPPPTELASPGRMNAKGISMFYGATNADVALAEIRPPVGSRVVMGEFELTKPLTLLNLSQLKNSTIQGSVFDPEYIKILSRTQFLKSLVKLMTRPTNPMKDSEYLPTQVIADYLANAHSNKIDGILYPSSQSKKDGLNVVLFHHASKVAAMDIPKGTRFISDTFEQEEDHERPHYSVTEYVPLKEDESENFGMIEPEYVFTRVSNNKERNNNLWINPKLLKVHEILPILIETKEYEVERSRLTDIKVDF